MSRFTDLLSELRQFDEVAKIEAKAASKIDKSVMETICAFANEPGLGGGTLLLGVARNGGPDGPTYEVVGISDIDKVQNDLASRCGNDFNSPVRPQIWVEEVEGRAVIGVTVPESEPSLKPIFLSADGLPQGARRRIGASDQRCTEDDLLALYEGRQSQSFDATPVPWAEMTDLDPGVVADYRRSRSRMNPSAEELAWSDVDLLHSIGCVTRTEGGVLRPTVAGVLLFGRGPTLRRAFQ